MIETQGLSKRFGSFQAVHHVSIKVRPGEVLGLLGPNGAGKTTTVRMLTSALPPSAGWARIDGWDVREHPVQVRHAVGALTEQHGLYARMNAREYLSFFGQVYGLRGEQLARRIDELLAYFALDEMADVVTETFSKGMRQKLALARALLHEPPVLLLDEPTSAMDPESAQLVRHEILRLRSTERAILLCTHNMPEAEMLCDRVAVMHHGRILAQGRPDELKRRFLGVPLYELELAQDWQPRDWPEGVEAVSSAPRRVRLRIEDPQTINPRLIAWLVEQGAPVLSLRALSQSLEEVYLSIMQQFNEGLL